MLVLIGCRDAMSEAQRLAYIDAVKCLQGKAPSQSNAFARSRYDEFLLTHIDQTLKVHFSVSALTIEIVKS